MKKQTLSIKETARILDKSEQFVRIGLQRGILPFGHAFQIVGEGRHHRYSYVVYRKKLEEYIGELPDEIVEIQEGAEQ